MIAAHEKTEKHEELVELLKCREELKLDTIPAVVVEQGSNRLAEGLTVHFVRHGRSEHNVFAAEWTAAGKAGNAYCDEGCPIDAVLVDEGEADAKGAGSILRKCIQGKALCVVSPMKRTIQTCLIATLEGDLKFESTTVHESLRERFGLHRCDTMAADYNRKTTFPTIDWADMYEATKDPALSGDREPYADLLRRGHRCISHLKSLGEEREIVCFSHSSFLFALFNGVLALEDAKPFATGEVRSVVLI